MNNLTITQKNILIMALKDYKLNMIKLKDFRFVDREYADEAIKDLNIIFSELLIASFFVAPSIDDSSTGSTKSSFGGDVQDLIIN